jgi:hypothetical protein
MTKVTNIVDKIKDTTKIGTNCLERLERDRLPQWAFNYLRRGQQRRETGIVLGFTGKE